MRNPATNTAAASLVGCAAIFAIVQFAANTATTDFTEQDHALRRVLVRAAHLIGAPLQRCYVESLDPPGHAGETPEDRDARLLFAGLSCDGGMILAGG
jgi:hypothetical protein